jgi:hypothetical protein
MTCAECGATIADKAIVCYRCGTATALPERPPAVRAEANRPWGLIAVLLVLAAGAGWLAVAITDRPWRVGVLVVAVLLAGWAIRLWVAATTGRR